MILKSILSTAAVCLLTGFGASLHAQDAKPTKMTQPRADRIPTTEPVAKKSPMNSASLLTPDGYARIVYSQPMLRGRKMMGDEVGYDKMWRLGANEATEIFTTEELEINGEELPAGAHSVFCIPGETMWTLVFNSALGEWGAYGYDESKDVLRVEVPVTANEQPYEAFTIFFEPAAEGSEDQDKLVMAWGGSRAEAMVEFDD